MALSVSSSPTVSVNLDAQVDLVDIVDLGHLVNLVDLVDLN